MKLTIAAKELMKKVQGTFFDTPIELVTIDYSSGLDANGDPVTNLVTTVIWSGDAALHPNLPRYERSAVAQEVLGVEERRVVYYAYVPYSAPVLTPGCAVRYNGRVYEPIKEPLPMGGEPASTWRLDCGSPL